jgi:hypothetical protein
MRPDAGALASMAREAVFRVVESIYRAIESGGPGGLPEIDLRVMLAAAGCTPEQYQELIEALLRIGDVERTPGGRLRLVPPDVRDAREARELTAAYLAAIEHPPRTREDLERIGDARCDLVCCCHGTPEELAALERPVPVDPRLATWPPPPHALSWAEPLADGTPRYVLIEGRSGHGWRIEDREAAAVVWSAPLPVPETET